MPIKYTSTDKNGESYDWMLERGGRLFSRLTGTQRWHQVMDGIQSPKQATALIAKEGHTVKEDN